MISKPIKILVGLFLLLGGIVFLHKGWADDYAFPIKSGIIEYDTTHSYTGKESLKGKEVFYFDNWGKKGALHIKKEIWEDDKKVLKKEKIVLDFPWGYLIDMKNNTAEKIEFPFHLLRLSNVSEKMKQAKWTQYEEKIIGGRKCTNWITNEQDEDFEIETCLWRDSVIFLEYKTTNETKVMTSFQENVSVSKDKIELPPNISIVSEEHFNDVLQDFSDKLSSWSDYGNQPHVKLFENDAFAHRGLKGLSMASETYVIANNGKYPESVYDLLSAPIPYITENVCENKDNGYIIKCDFSLDGYTITATPIVPDITGSAKVVIKTGGDITPKTYKNIKDYTAEDRQLLKEKVELLKMQNKL